MPNPRATQFLDPKGLCAQYLSPLKRGERERDTYIAVYNGYKYIYIYTYAFYI